MKTVAKLYSFIAYAFSYPMNLLGYSVSFGNIFAFICLVSIVAWLMCKIFF